MKKEAQKIIQNNPSKWERTSWFLRILILISGCYQTFFGETAIGIFILISLFFIVSPKYLSRGKIQRLPIEIEVILFVMVTLQLVIGEARDFYTNVPYYDKIVHYFLPMFVGLMGFLFAYTMVAMGSLKMSNRTMVLVVILLSLGIGALWEIYEYLSDQLIYPYVPGWHHFQGNAQQNALDDTMTDLIYDTLGGVFGALLGLRYITKLKGKDTKRLSSLTKEFSVFFQGNDKKAPPAN